jgi:signal transduction histidine kinase
VRVGRSGTITVSDEGPGIPAEHRERIFEPFHRLQPRPRGAGLGLNLVREIVRWHDGEIAVLDGSHGASFRITLPLAQGD